MFVVVFSLLSGCVNTSSSGNIKVSSEVPEKSPGENQLENTMENNEFSKQDGLEYLKSTVKLENELEFVDAQMEEGKSGYKWDDGSYYVYTVKDKTAEVYGDLGMLYVMNKSTKKIYMLDLDKDPTGNILKGIMII